MKRASSELYSQKEMTNSEQYACTERSRSMTLKKQLK